MKLCRGKSCVPGTKWPEREQYRTQRASLSFTQLIVYAWICGYEMNQNKKLRFRLWIAIWLRLTNSLVVVVLLFLFMAHTLRIRYAAGRHQQQNDKKKLSDNCTAYCDVNFAWSASKWEMKTFSLICLIHQFDCAEFLPPNISRPNVSWLNWSTLFIVVVLLSNALDSIRKPMNV